MVSDKWRFKIKRKESLLFCDILPQRGWPGKPEGFDPPKLSAKQVLCGAKYYKNSSHSHLGYPLFTTTVPEVWVSKSGSD